MGIKTTSITISPCTLCFHSNLSQIFNLNSSSLTCNNAIIEKYQFETNMCCKIIRNLLSQSNFKTMEIACHPQLNTNSFVNFILFNSMSNQCKLLRHGDVTDVHPHSTRNRWQTRTGRYLHILFRRLRRHFLDEFLFFTFH